MNEKGFDYWDFFAGEAERAGAPLYARLSRGIGGDPDLREFASNVRKGQPPANVFLSAVHFLLLRGAQHPLRGFFANLNGGTVVKDEDPFPVFKDFVSVYRGQLAPIVAGRITNTNEVGRSALLHAGFRAAARETGEPLNLIEIGPSAGLNLIWDKYGVRYRRGEETFFTEPRDAVLAIDCELKSDIVPPLGAPPRIASRIGLELNPVDLTGPDERDWLKALVWPDQIDRFSRLEKALEIYAREKPDIRAGDALDLLPEAIARIPEDEPVCVYHTMVVYQFSEEAREALDNFLLGASVRRPIWRLGFEGSLKGENALTLGHYRAGQRQVRTLALCHPHGTWMEWRS
ncbi:MAG TPA: DUF2332 domain-containing protein [Rhizomicrobium sp.]|nr:DUF2332 domain-containing protein [Rhizomicrobium sp.]